MRTIPAGPFVVRIDDLDDYTTIFVEYRPRASDDPVTLVVVDDYYAGATGMTTTRDDNAPATIYLHVDPNTGKAHDDPVGAALDRFETLIHYRPEEDPTWEPT
jgi:hypothetical protein